MPRIDDKAFYEAAIKIHGITAMGLNWHSNLSQEIRFDVILEMLPNDLESFTLCDAGCGFGDFYTFMEKNFQMCKKYIGVDALEFMCNVAKEKTGCEIIQADICKESLPHADYYICSDAMNVLSEFETHLFIRNCFSACSIGFIFNILHGDFDTTTYNYTTTQQIENIAKELGVKCVTYSQGYMENDITVGFFK
ncbi:MAG: class I SAM-dependent methyltransferase [Campylobacterales bacterium]|nr:class I SAM-dependent methyltransferase [Campylobacterales bacterium]